MRIFICLTFFAIFNFSCKQQSVHSKNSAPAWLDPIIKNSDSTYEKPYFRTDFVMAVYYINNKDSSICQVMKDSAGVIRQISISKKNIRSFFAPYYANGQLQADINFDAAGRYNGAVTNYHENGSIQSTGKYTHGLMTGKWKNFDEKGRLLSTDEYDSNGQLVKPTGRN